jgi:hypothetical protein
LVSVFIFQLSFLTSQLKCNDLWGKRRGKEEERKRKGRGKGKGKRREDMEEEISERNSNGKDDNQGEKEDNNGREEKAGMKRTKGKERAETEERRRSRSHCGFVSGFVLATDHRHKPHFKNIQNYFPSCDPDPHAKDADTHTYILKLILIQF